MNNILRRQFLSNVAQTSVAPMMIEVARAKGIYLYTPQGKRYVDLVSGVSVSNVGHNNKRVIRAINKQVKSYLHTMVYGENIQRPQVMYAEKIASYTELDSVFFVNSGSEAIEGAMKLAKRYTDRGQIISMRKAYHGSTQGALSIQGEETFKQAFRPLLPDCIQLEFNSLSKLKEISHKTAAVVCEVVQGESGVNPANREWLMALRQRCDDVGAMLIFDEIQTGFGRTGTMFAFQKYNVKPDILCLAKALGGGMPLGAFVAKREVMNTLTYNPVLGHITTFGGHPVCCAAGLEAMNYILDKNLAENAEKQGAIFEEILIMHSKVVEVRRSGLLLAIELGDAERMYRMINIMMERGYMSDWFLFCDTAFRISPPLTITEKQTREIATELLRLLDEIGD